MLAQHQPALVLDYLQRCETDGVALTLPTATSKLSAAAYLALLARAAKATASPDTAFMLGQQMLPGHFGAASHALLHAQTLREALQLLVDWQAILCPLLRPRLSDEGSVAVLYWMDCYGAPSQLPFLVEMHMTAVTAMCRWLSGQRVPWRYCFNRASPRHIEQHTVHLGPELRFNCQLDAMLIEPGWLDQPWPRGNAMAVKLAFGQLRDAQSTPSLSSALYDYLLAHIRCVPTLESTAAAFGVSVATFKRHLARHGTHFQAELDQVRTHVALQLFHTHGYDNEATARHLGFHDANNFRRSFKRWTGLTPSLLREGLA